MRKRSVKAVAIGSALILSAGLIISWPFRGAKALEPVAAVLESVFSCGGLGDDSGRVACYDSTVTVLKEAVRSGQLVIVDRQKIRTVRRQAFGFNLPSLDLLGNIGGGSDKGAKSVIDEGDLKSVTLSVVSAAQTSNGGWQITFDDGSTWRQTDSFGDLRTPKKGLKAEISKAMMGSYFMSLEGGRLVRVKRVQ